MNTNEVKILLFGILTEHCKCRELVFTNITGTDQLLQELTKRFPSITQLKFSVAVDRKITHGNVSIDINNEVALLPPFSGG